MAGQFGADNGAVAVITALALTLLCCFVGGAIDYGRVVNARSHIQRAADVAALAAGRDPDITSAKATEIANAFFKTETNGLIAQSVPNVTVTRTGTEIKVEARVDVPVTSST